MRPCLQTCFQGIAYGSTGFKAEPEVCTVLDSRMVLKLKAVPLGRLAWELPSLKNWVKKVGSGVC